MRLGRERGIEEVKEHAWLRDFPWEELSEGKLRPPFVPEVDQEDLGSHEIDSELIQ